MELGKLIKKQRAELGLTQEEVAKKLSVTRQTLSNWENEKSYPDLDQLLKLSDIYHFSIDSLLRGDPELRKSLDSGKVKRILEPLNYLLIFLLAVMGAVGFIDTKALRLIMDIAILIVPIIIGFVQLRMDHYIGYSLPTLKDFVKTLVLVVPTLIVIGGAIFFTVGHQNMHNTVGITLAIFIILIIVFYALMKFGFHALHVNNEAKEHGMTLDEWLVEEDKAKKNGMTMDEWLKERETDKSNANESEGDNDDEDVK